MRNEHAFLLDHVIQGNSNNIIYPIYYKIKILCLYRYYELLIHTYIIYLYINMILSLGQALFPATGHIYTLWVALGLTHGIDITGK